MEFDLHCQNLNGVEPLAPDNGEIYPAEYHVLDDNRPAFLEAKIVYLLMQKNVPVSRASRLQWLLDHLNTIITSGQKLNESSDNLEVISVIPREQNSTKCNRFLITYHTEVKFLAQSYRFVYCLDMSPSHSNVDVHKGEILFDEILNCFKASIEALCKEFVIPGNPITFRPCIYLTVIVNTPFFMSPAQQVLVKGVQVTLSNLDETVKYVEKQFYLLEGRVADVSALALDQLDCQRTQNEGLVGDLFDLPDSRKMYSKIPMVTPDVNFVNMLRYSMLAISLLPDNSMSHILVITDGIVAMPDSNIMESLLFQLHYDSISISFLKVGSSFYPHSSVGFVSYADLLYFFAHSTLGTYLENFVYIKPDTSLQMNMYQEMFLLWSFHSANKYASSKICDNSNWTSSNEIFCVRKVPSFLSKHQTDEDTSASILLLLSRRMREGFTVDNIFYMNRNLEIKLILQWKSSIYVHYKVRSQWPVVKNQTYFEISISAPYQFLHDITCIIKKESKSLYRQAFIERFWMRLSQLSSGDIGLAQQFSSFQSNKDWYILPDSVRNGIPVFVLNNANFSDAMRLTLTPSDVSCLKFIHMWQPICQMETSNWRKWFHTYKVSLILKHDNPLPKHLHLANSSQRFQVVQCRQAATTLYGMLAEWASFILIDNNTYLKLLYKEIDKQPLWFCILRVSSKFPCAVLNIGFSTGTPGNTRRKIYDELKLVISALSYLSSPLKVKENFCCMLLQKPLEKILIRYERIPNNYTTVIFPDGTQPPNSTLNLPSPITGTLFTTLSRYLFHKRWIWSATHPSNPKLPDQSVSRILSTLTRMRIKEGFSFAHSASGIITMVLELWMEPSATCVIQYVLFPPHCASLSDEMYSGSEDDNEYFSDTETELQMITEVWIEPQYGKVVPGHAQIGYADNKRYNEIADAIYEVDLKCITTLLTMEHLSLMCQVKNLDCLNMNASLENINQTNLNSSRKSFSRKSSRNIYLDYSPSVLGKGTQFPIISPRIEHISFRFDAIEILPLCQQTELLFSMFIEPNGRSSCDNNVDKANRLLIDNILEHIGILHDQELKLSKEESDRFTQEILRRHKNKHPQIYPKSETMSCQGTPLDNKKKAGSQWRCFIKGVSVTHVILTFLASTLEDVKALMALYLHAKIPDLNEGVERTSSQESNYSDVPINASKSLCLPIYVFDCPLSRLVNAYVSNNDDYLPVNEDVYEDHRFKIDILYQEEYLKLKGEDNCRGTEEIKENDSDYSSVKHHCKTVVLTHSKCFTISLFVSLHLGVFLHSFDIQAAMDQCEESIIEIDVTEYITTICRHIKKQNSDKVSIKYLSQTFPCCELESLHVLIKDKFFKMLSGTFYPIPNHQEYYFYKHLKNVEVFEDDDSDDEISNSQSDILELISEQEPSIFSEESNLVQRMESGLGGRCEVTPLFLHLICTVKYNNGEILNTYMRVIPTCLGELIQNLDTSIEFLDVTKLQVTLDMLCLTLPTDVQNIIIDYSTQSLRTVSFSSDGFQPSIGSTISDASYNSEVSEPLKHLSDCQKKSIFAIRDEIKWLIRDETCTALLDLEPVTSDTLHYVMTHVSDGKEARSSCMLDNLNLNFVYSSAQSHEKFLQEFAKLKLPYSGYKLCKEDNLYYLAKDCTDQKENLFYDDSALMTKTGVMNSAEVYYTENELFNSSDELINSDLKLMDHDSQHSEISSINELMGEIGGVYDEDAREDYEDYGWLINLENNREHLPNFWLIMKIAQDVVTIYFHCRFLELPTIHVGVYLEVQRAICEAIRDICKKVNQLLLLQDLYETKLCNPLLEVDDNTEICMSPIPRNSTYTRIKSLDVLENKEEGDANSYSTSLTEASLNFQAGYFSCPIVWETHFVLHSRLKTGPGKSGISRGILALKHILDKFSVSNRNNMFVYRDNQNSVFYLRLYENLHYSNNKLLLFRANEFENGTVSRSPSIASLPLGQTKSNLTQSDQSVTSANLIDIRPRVRSFGEQESKNAPNEDTLILKVHGVNEAGSDVQHDLVQVLQNRLDDAVLEFLSIMLARNSMCPLTPEDVHFIQKPFRPPEVIIRLTIQEFTLPLFDSFIHYLKQNLLQFLNVPKYTDARSHYHFKDYVENEDVNNLVCEDNIFIYNQSQNPSSGSRGIACVSLATNNNFENNIQAKSICIASIFATREFETTVAAEIIDSEDECPNTYLEFRLWKQGRVNVENLSQKLKSAVSQATWDIIMEYYILKEPLCVHNSILNKNVKSGCAKIESFETDLSKEVEFNCILDMTYEQNIRKNVYNTNKPKFEYFLTRNKRNRHFIPPTPKVTRSITFNDTEREQELLKMKSQAHKSNIKLDGHLTGDLGVLSVIYSKYLPDWLEFGYSINTPSVKKHKINCANRHLPNIIIGELTNIIQDCPKVFRCIPNNCIRIKSDDMFVPDTASNLIDKYIIILRNFEHWLSSISMNDTTEFPDNMSPHTLKHSQKFVPGITNNVFIPRQKILWIFVENECITLYAYNWAKNIIDKLIASCINLGHWLCVRSCFLNSVTSQKLGLFHNQQIMRKPFISPNNPYLNLIGSIEGIISFSQDYSQKRAQPAYNLATALEAFRDNFRFGRYAYKDTTVCFTLEMREMKTLEKRNRDEMKTLHAMYQSRTSSVTVPQIYLLMQNSRIVHYCYTPLLFLPRWRLKSASTRDHSLYPSQAIQLADKMTSEEKEIWHTELCYGFITEYKHYLQTLGFMPLQIDNPHRNTRVWTKDKSSYNNVFYIEKTILGGILMFTVEFNEPFFTTKLLAVECSRLQNISSRGSINRFTLSFLDECDRVKILMHLHSFTYDYHLRCIYNYISGTAGVNKVCERYNVNQFLDDFMKYYNKVPNFARNLVHTDTLMIKDLLTEGNQLYEYLLSNASQYHFKIFEMDLYEGESETILVQVTSTPQVSYKDSQDRQHTDDFDIAVAVYNMRTPHSPGENVLHLRYYLILTSKREMFPKSEVDEKLGKFRTVSSTARSISVLKREQTDSETSQIESEITNTVNHDNTSELVNFSKQLDEEGVFNDGVGQPSSSLPYVEIIQEVVNYLGYYSSHEQLMQQLILDKASMTQKHIKDMVAKGMVHCQTNLLWNRLTSPQENNDLTYEEFLELKSLAKLEHLCHMHQNLEPLLNQPVSWYQGLAKLLLIKYVDYNRSFISADGNIQYYVILHQRYFGAFMLLSMDMHTARGGLYAVHRKPQKQDEELFLAYQKSLLDGFVNCICFYLWSGMISN